MKAKIIGMNEKSILYMGFLNTIVGYFTSVKVTINVRRVLDYIQTF